MKPTNGMTPSLPNLPMSFILTIRFLFDRLPHQLRADSSARIETNRPEFIGRLVRSTSKKKARESLFACFYPCIFRLGLIFGVSDCR
jgi:hypothetical protein